MKAKNLSLVLLALIAVFGVLSFVSAAADFTFVKSGTLSETSDATITLTNTGDVALSIDLSETSDFGVEFSLSNPITLAVGEEKTSTVSLLDSSVLEVGVNDITVKAADTISGVNRSLTFTLSESFCEAGSVGGNLEISRIDINNNGEGDSEEWNLLDEIEIEVKVENNGNIDVDDVTVELGLFDGSGNNQVNDLDFSNKDDEKFDFGNIDQDEDATETFVFKLPADFEDGNYRLVVKAYSDDLGEDEECVDESSDLNVDDIYTTIDIKRENDEGKFIAFDNMVFEPMDATCGETVTLTTDVYNIGDEDQDQVKVILRNTVLNIDEFFEIKNNLDQGDREQVSLTFDVPQDAEDKTYALELSAEYQYDDGDYDQESDEPTDVLLTVVGCEAVTDDGSTDDDNGGEPQTNFALIGATLDSDAMSGKPLVVTATITNLKSTSASFAVGAVGYESWSELDSVSPQVFSLSPFESREVTITLNVNEETLGEESFDIEVRSATGLETREVSVNIEESNAETGSSFSGFSFGDNAYLWVIGIINVVLVVLIIVVAVRISRR